MTEEKKKRRYWKRGPRRKKESDAPVTPAAGEETGAPLAEGAGRRAGLSFPRPGPAPPHLPFLPRPPPGFAFRRGPGSYLPRNPSGLKLSTAPAAAPSAPFPDAVLCADRLGNLENFRRRFGRFFAYALAPRLFREEIGRAHG